MLEVQLGVLYDQTFIFDQFIFGPSGAECEFTPVRAPLIGVDVFLGAFEGFCNAFEVGEDAREEWQIEEGDGEGISYEFVLSLVFAGANEHAMKWRMRWHVDVGRWIGLFCVLCD